MNYKDLEKYFRKKNVLITGHTGFKGSWLLTWLSLYKSNLMGISLEPSTKPSHFNELKVKNRIKDVKLDIVNFKKLKKEIIKFKPDFIFHLAAQPLVNISYKDPLKTWNTNLIGTLNILESLKFLKKKCVCVIVTSDKCYRNYEKKGGYKEEDELGGVDPYSASKGSAEIAVRSYIRSFYYDKKKYRIATARAGNVIGGGDWTKGRLIPDCVVAAKNNKKVKIRNLNSTRPWQHILELVYGYLKLAAHLKKTPNLHGESFNFGPSNIKKKYLVSDILKEIKKSWKKFDWQKLNLNKKTINETRLLILNSKKIKKMINWELQMNFKQTINKTISWYEAFYKMKKNNKNVFNLSKNQIENYAKKHLNLK